MQPGSRSRVVRALDDLRHALAVATLLADSEPRQAREVVRAAVRAFLRATQV